MKIEEVRDIAKLKLPRGKTKAAYSSSVHRGLQFVLKPHKKAWYHRYQKPGGGRTTKLLGTQYPDTDYADAVALLQSNKAMLAKGLDPVDQAQAGFRAKRQQQYLKGASVEQRYRLSTLAAAFLEHCEATTRTGTVVRYRSSLGVHLLPNFGGIDVRYFHYPDFEVFIHQLAKQSPSAARHAFAVLRAMFSYLVAERVVEANPLLGRKQLTKATRVYPRDSYLTHQQIHKFVNELPQQDIPDDAKIILMVQLQSGLRIGEVCGLEWAQVDTKAGVIHHVAESMKGGERAQTALSKGLLHTLVAWKKQTAKRKRLFSQEWNTAAMVDLVRNNLRDWIVFTTHDIRRTVATTLQELGCPEEIRRRIANHKVSQGIGQAYDKSQQIKLQLYWLEHWADALDGLKLDPHYLDNDEVDSERAALLAQLGGSL